MSPDYRVKRKGGKKHEDGRLVKKVPVQQWGLDVPGPWCL